jgi:hypothetical protein
VARRRHLGAPGERRRGAAPPPSRSRRSHRSLPPPPAHAGVAPEPCWEPAPPEPGPPGGGGRAAWAGQAEGWAESLAAIRAAAALHAPIDGLLGFSQGAAAAALLCAEAQLEARGAEEGTGGAPRGAGSGGAGGWAPRFAVLLSGFPAPGPRHAELMARAGPICLPSLHVFPAAAAATPDGPDAAALDGPGASAVAGVAPADSEALAAAFDPAAGRALARHGGGHDVPRTKALLRAVVDFVSAQAAAP